MGVALGRGPARLAHRVLGDGRGGARRRRSRCTAAARTSSSRTTRTRSPRPRRRAASRSRRTWMHNGMVEMGDEKMAKSVGNIRLLHAALDQFGRDAFLMWMVGAHYRKPVAYRRRRSRTRRRAVARVRDVMPPAGSRTPPGTRRVPRARSSTRWRTTSTRRRPAPCCSTGWRRPTAAWTRARRVGRGGCGEMLYALGLETLLEADEEAPEELQQLAAERDEARAARDFERADRIRDQLAERAGRSATPPTGARLVRRAVIVYGRNAVREALRGKRRVQRVFATERAAQEVWLGGRRDGDRGAVGDRGALRLARPPGHLRRGRAYPYADADSLLEPTTRSCSPSTRSRIRTTSARSPRGRGAGCARRRGARAALGRGHARGVPGVGGRGGAPARSRGCGTSPTGSCRRRSARDLGLRRGGRRPRCPTTARTTAGGWCWCSAARARACARAWPRPATSSCACPTRGGSARSTCRPPRRRSCTESCIFAGRPLTGLHNPA